MSTHKFLFMEVPKVGKWALLFDRDVHRSGFIGVCQETGETVVVFNRDGWSRVPNAPKRRVDRLKFAMNFYCRDKDQLGHKHVFGP